MSKTETISASLNYGSLAELQNYIQQLEAKNSLMQKLSTRLGFYTHYFANLAFYKSTKECFDSVNKEYFSLFGSHRYTDYQSFKMALHHGRA